MKNTGATIAAVGAGIGQMAAQIPGQIRKEKEFKYQEEQRAQAIKDLEKDWSKAGLTYKTLKATYKQRATAAGLDPSEIEANLLEFPMPKESDKKDIGRYFDSLSIIYGTKNKALTKKQNELKEIEKGKETASAVQAGMGGREAGFAQPTVSPEQTQIAGPQGQPQFTEQDVTARDRTPAIPPAETKEQAFEQAAQVQPGLTAPDFEKYGGKYLPTQMDKDKLAAQEAKWSQQLKMQKERLARTQAEQNNDDFTKESNSLFSNATRYETITNTTQKQIADTEQKMSDLTTEDSKLRQKITDEESIWMPGEKEQAQADLKQIEKDRESAEDRMVKLNERLINQSEKKIIADQALDIYIQTKGRIGYRGALKHGQEASKEGETPQKTEPAPKPYSYSPLGGVGPLRPQTNSVNPIQKRKGGGF